MSQSTHAEQTAKARCPLRIATMNALYKLKGRSESYDDYIRSQIPSVKSLAESEEMIANNARVGEP